MAKKIFSSILLYEELVNTKYFSSKSSKANSMYSEVSIFEDLGHIRLPSGFSPKRTSFLL